MRGREAHSSLAPTGVNAVEYASAVIAFLHNMARDFRTDGASDEEYDCPHTTVHVGLVHGGTALNIVPADCRFEFEFRHLPCDDPEEIFARVQAFVDEELLPEMRDVYPDAAVTFEPMAVIPPLDTDEDAIVTQFAKSITGENNVRKVSYNCEACLFHGADVPTIICGPGDIDQAHKPNEFIELVHILHILRQPSRDDRARFLQHVCRYRSVERGRLCGGPGGRGRIGDNVLRLVSATS